MSHDSVQYGVAEEFQSLVVDGLSFFPVHDAFVHQRLFVEVYVFWVEAQDLV